MGNVAYKGFRKLFRTTTLLCSIHLIDFFCLVTLSNLCKPEIIDTSFKFSYGIYEGFALSEWSGFQNQL